MLAAAQERPQLVRCRQRSPIRATASAPRVDCSSSIPPAWFRLASTQERAGGGAKCEEESWLCRGRRDLSARPREGRGTWRDASAAALTTIPTTRGVTTIGRPKNPIIGRPEVALDG